MILKIRENNNWKKYTCVHECVVTGRKKEWGDERGKNGEERGRREHLALKTNIRVLLKQNSEIIVRITAEGEVPKGFFFFSSLLMRIIKSLT